MSSIWEKFSEVASFAKIFGKSPEKFSDYSKVKVNFSEIKCSLPESVVPEFGGKEQWKSSIVGDVADFAKSSKAIRGKQIQARAAAATGPERIWVSRIFTFAPSAPCDVSSGKFQSAVRSIHAQ